MKVGDIVYSRYYSYEYKYQILSIIDSENKIVLKNLQEKYDNIEIVDKNDNSLFLSFKDVRKLQLNYKITSKKEFINEQIEELKKLEQQLKGIE